jgi:hypothetical protein
MAYRATLVSQDPLTYFLDKHDGEPHLRVSDVLLRVNRSPKEVFAHLIRIGTNSKWSHSALVYLTSDPRWGYNNTFLVEALTKGIHITSWRNEVTPFKQFTVGVKRPRLDWYVETPYEISRHDPCDPEDVHGLSYLRHVRGIALDQINGLFDRKVVYELAALYAERIAKRHLHRIPQVADAAAAVADFFEKWDASNSSTTNMLRFICSGLVQYSFFSALRIRILNGLANPDERDAAMSNLSNMQRIIFREDPEGVVREYIQQVQAGKRDLADPIPDNVLDLLKTATPADFNNSPNLEWRYVILEGLVWQIYEAPDDYRPQDDDEAAILELLSPEHRE